MKGDKKMWYVYAESKHNPGIYGEWSGEHYTHKEDAEKEMIYERDCTDAGKDYYFYVKEF